MERRVAITPADAAKLIETGKLEFFVERSGKRVFPDEEYARAGAHLVDDVRDVPVIFGVKELPVDYFRDNHTYVFFSHTIKGQSYNMPALKKMVEKKVNLIDYEKIADKEGRRLIFFGRYAGLAGMINGLWALGLRLKAMGIPNPLERIEQAHTYASLEDARRVIREAGQEIEKKGIPGLDVPLVIGFTGYGNVSGGAREIAALLPIVEIEPHGLLDLYASGKWERGKVYQVVFREEHLVVPMDPGQPFELEDYYHHPEKYRSDFEQYIDKMTLLMNCMYWDERYPRLITNQYLKANYHHNHPLKVIGDITCDPHGSVECTLHCTEIENPNFIYDPQNGTITQGHEGEGILIMAVDILPSELPLESSRAFSTALFPFVEAIVKADYSRPFAELDLPGPIKRALILHQGVFTPDYTYMKKYIED
jgi:alpha-aminoadipic semialdehyde synthase